MLVSPALQPVATIKAYRKTGHAVVTIDRQGRTVRRYRVSLRRYNAFRRWTVEMYSTPNASGVWLRSSLTVHVWMGEAAV